MHNIFGMCPEKSSGVMFGGMSRYIIGPSEPNHCPRNVLSSKFLISVCQQRGTSSCWALCEVALPQAVEPLTTPACQGRQPHSQWSYQKQRASKSVLQKTAIYTQLAAILHMFPDAMGWARNLLSSSVWSVSLTTDILYYKGKAIPVTGHEGPLGCETSRLPHFLENRLKDGGEVVSPMHQLPFTPRKIPGTHFC
jgi:hypothetical protein